MEISWEEAEVAARNKSEWRQSVAQFIHLDAGWIKVKVKVSWTELHSVSKTSKIIFVITMSNFHQIWQFLAQRWQIV